jgi:hypothetical protein
MDNAARHQSGKGATPTKSHRSKSQEEPQMSLFKKIVQAFESPRQEEAPPKTKREYAPKRPEPHQLTRAYLNSLNDSRVYPEERRRILMPILLYIQEHPDDVDAYPEIERGSIQYVIKANAERLAKEAENLTSLGLPLPRQLTDLTLKTAVDLIYLGISGTTYIYPTFELPPYVAFAVATPLASSLDQKLDALYNKDKRVFYTTYCILGDAAAVAAARETCARQGITAVVEQYPGRWLNRDPYALYQVIQHPEMQKLFDPKISPLAAVQGFTPDQLRQRERHLRLLGSAATGAYIHNRAGESEPISAPPQDLYLTRPLLCEISLDLDKSPPLPALELPPDAITLKILLGSDTRLNVAEQFLDGCRTAQAPVLFGFRSSDSAQYFYLTCAPADWPLIEQQLRACYPEFEAIEHNNEALPEAQTLIATQQYQYYPLKPGARFSVDPYRMLFTLLADDTHPATVDIQMLFAPVPVKVVTKLARFTLFRSNQERFDPERHKQLEKKQPPWSVVVSFTGTDRSLLERVSASFLRQYETVEQSWQFCEPALDIEPPWNLLSTAELAALAHFPGKDIQSDRLETISMKTKLSPTLYTETTPTAIAIGQTSHRKQTVTVRLPAQVRDRHVYIVGKSGMGKSTLITNMAAQDIQAGRGVAIVDPHGDLIDDLLPYIPPERIEDTIFFNPADKAHPVTLSPLACSDEDEYEQVVSDLVTTMSRLTESWGHQIEYLFRAIFNTLVRVPGATFIDVHDIIASEKRREELLRQVNHPRVLNFWYEQFETLLPKSARLPILTRMERVVDSPTLSRILNSAESRLNFTDVIENKKIFLGRLSKGEIGEDSVKLLGSILTSQIQLAIMRRARMAKEQRTPFYLYVDEFQNFTTPTFETILSEARKYQLSLTFAHQFVSQLNDQMRSAILGNVSTVMMFALDIADARKLEGQLGSYTSDDVAQLPKHHLFCRPATSSQDTFPMETLAPLPRHAVNSTRAIIEYTRATYSATAKPQPAAEVVKLPETPHVASKPAAPPSAPRPTRTPQPGAKVRLLKAEPPDGLSTKEKILFYVQQAEYLATPHLITLCFGSYSTEASKKANASAILKDLIESKQLRMQPFGRGNVYFTGRTPNPTNHNLAVRDLFVKLTRSGYAVADLQFAYEHIPGCVPDLYVSFSGEDGEAVSTFWEYDTGTEGMAEIERKLKRYGATGYDRLVFVVPGDARRQQLLRTINQPGVYVVMLEELSGLAESVF